MNNRKTAGKIQLVLTLVIIGLLALWICSITMQSLASIENLQSISMLLLIVVVLYFLLGGFYYVELEHEDDVINVKFYNSFPFSREFKMYRIPVSALISYEITGNAFFQQKLVLFQMTSNQASKYPPIYITAMSAKDKAKLFAFLNELVK
ncbi:hypothetical protein [Saccharicrinis aurantiacus]|uniref:hypothetical protein n=1 Tax=Saccharicrinis aurantiacus TaxID=1849719 RepID=UPI00248F80B2|nr:hypothetical protein [Saccharicrinis aurantiacus]